MEGRTSARAGAGLVGGGELAGLHRTTHWSRTPLGALHERPQSLPTAVSVAEHARSMGQGLRECWAPARGVVTRHGGRIGAAAAVGRGAAYFITPGRKR
jgi:hypothetical protein